MCWAAAKASFSSSDFVRDARQLEVMVPCLFVKVSDSMTNYPRIIFVWIGFTRVSGAN